MRIIFTAHARKRLKERKIRVKDVSSALLRPDWYEPTFGNRIRVQKKLKGQKIEVIYTEENNSMIVITSYLL